MEPGHWRSFLAAETGELSYAKKKCTLKDVARFDLILQIIFHPFK